MNSTFLKWAGGKNWFVKNYSGRFPGDYNRYIDPFLGGGSVFFYLEPERALISDINSELITTFQAIKDDWEAVDAKLRMHAENHSKEYYYRTRASKPMNPCDVAARMIYLNRVCFNGIYRVNDKGEFNVPIGSKTTVILGTEKFEERAYLLKNADICCCDFEETIEMAEEGDFLFCDPPYAVLEETRFVGYTKRTFDWNDQLRLAEALTRAARRGVKILMTNVDHHKVRALYENDDIYELDSLSRISCISGKSNGRNRYSELIITANIQRGGTT